jgi:hypothetical protein
MKILYHFFPGQTKKNDHFFIDRSDFKSPAHQVTTFTCKYQIVNSTDRVTQFYFSLFTYLKFSNDQKQFYLLLASFLGNILLGIELIYYPESYYENQNQ